MLNTTRSQARTTTSLVRRWRNSLPVRSSWPEPLYCSHNGAWTRSAMLTLLALPTCIALVERDDPRTSQGEIQMPRSLGMEIMSCHKAEAHHTLCAELTPTPGAFFSTVS